MTEVSKRPLARGNHYRGRPVRERRTPVNVGNRPHRDNGEGLASGLPLTHLNLHKDRVQPLWGA